MDTKNNRQRKSGRNGTVMLCFPAGTKISSNTIKACQLIEASGFNVKKRPLGRKTLNRILNDIILENTAPEEKN